MSVSVTIDGDTYDVPEGSRLIDVCHDIGIDIPHFCYHPGLGHDGNCRMCQVEIITPRGPMLAISCNTIVSDGMEVVTNSERVKKVRAAVEEFLLRDHPLDCPICDKAGECTLQDYYMEHDLQDSRMKFPRDKKGKAIVIGETLVLDQERCVLCNRCVRFLRDVAGDEQLFIAGRGHRSYITTFPGKEVTSPYSLNTVDLCPVGALTSRDFRFASPTWLLTRSPSVCTTCARGCSVEVHHRNGKVLRLCPRHNDQVNGYWMCDEGRLNYKFVNEDRLTDFEMDGQGGAMVEAVKHRIFSTLGLAENTAAGEEKSIGGANVLFLASLNCTLEELFLLKKLASKLQGAALVAVRHIPDGIEDVFLRRADRHSNGRSADILGIRCVDLREEGSAEDREEIEKLVSSSTVVFGIGFDCCISRPLLEIYSRAKTSVLVSACRTPLTGQASVVVPGLTFAEKEGLIINFEGFIQRFFSALTARGECLSEWRFISSLLSAASGRDAYMSISEVREAIRSEEAVFAEVDLNSISLGGKRLKDQDVRAD